MVAIGLSLTGCSSNPATGGKDIAFMSKDDEKRIGDENHPMILKQFGGEYDDPDLKSYVKSLGQVLAASSELPDIKWTFTLLDSDVTNAFALPGGYVYVTRGLLSLAETEGQLAAVIGHEIGHVTARHGAQRQAQGTLAGIGAMGASILGSIFVGPDAGRAIGQLANVGAQGYLASYSRDQEYQADELGIRYNGRIGFTPFGMSEFLEKLDSEKGLIAKLRGQAPRGSSYLDTHPPTPDRVVRARKLAQKTPVEKPLDGRDIYLSKIDGMIWGTLRNKVMRAMVLLRTKILTFYSVFLIILHFLILLSGSSPMARKMHPLVLIWVLKTMVALCETTFAKPGQEMLGWKALRQ